MAAMINRPWDDLSVVITAPRAGQAELARNVTGGGETWRYRKTSADSSNLCPLWM